MSRRGASVVRRRVSVMTWPTSASSRSASRSMRARSGCDGFAGAPLRERERHADARERRAELVRHVAQQRFLRRDQRLDALGHRVEVARQRADLVAAPSERRADARIEGAGGQRAAGLLQPHDRRRHVAREQQRHDGRGENRDRRARPPACRATSGCRRSSTGARANSSRYSSPSGPVMLGVSCTAGSSAACRAAAERGRVRSSARSSRGIARPSSSSPRSFVTSSTVPRAGRGFLKSQALSSRSPPRASAAETSRMISSRPSNSVCVNGRLTIWKRHVDRADRRDRHRDHERDEDLPEQAHGLTPPAARARSRCRGCCESARRRRHRCRACGAGC